MEAPALLQPCAVLVLNAGFAWLVGALCARVALKRAHPGLLQHLRPSLRKGEQIAALLCLTGSVVALWAATAQMADVSLTHAFGMLPSVMLTTEYGQAGMAAILIAILICAFRVPRRRNWELHGFLLLIFALTRAGASHQGEHGWFSPPMINECLHLMLIAAWMGSIALAAWVVLPAAARTVGAPRAYLQSLSHTATLALVGILVSGAWNAWQRLGSIDQLQGNPYGTALLVKLAFVAAAILLGAFNRFVGFPRALRGQRAPALVVLRIESILLLAALAAAALLVALPPAQ